MCEESWYSRGKSSESKDDQDKRENVEAKVNARNDKSPTTYVCTAKQHSYYCDGYLDRPKKLTLGKHLATYCTQLLGNPMRTAVSDFALPLSRVWLSLRLDSPNGTWASRFQW